MGHGDPPVKWLIALGVLVAAVFALILVAGRRNRVYLGNSRSGFSLAPVATALTPERARELAGPHLDESYRLRRARRGEKLSDAPRREAVDWITLKGDWFLISRDDYPSYSPGYYEHHAVRVHAHDGTVIPPSSPRS